MPYIHWSSPAASPQGGAQENLGILADIHANLENTKNNESAPISAEINWKNINKSYWPRKTKSLNNTKHVIYTA